MTKVAIVTGAGQRIGLAIAKRLHADGFKIGMLDYNAQAVQEAAASISKEDALAVTVDVSKREAVFDAFDQIVKKFGDLSVVVNNAGLGPTTPVETITEEQFKQVYGVIVGGVIW